MRLLQTYSGTTNRGRKASVSCWTAWYRRSCDTIQRYLCRCWKENGGVDIRKLQNRRIRLIQGKIGIGTAVSAPFALATDFISGMTDKLCPKICIKN